MGFSIEVVPAMRGDEHLAQTATLIINLIYRYLYITALVSLCQ